MERYARQELFSEIGKEGQEVLRSKTAAIVGMGALGTVASELLARAGIGRLVLVDRDIVELSNLQRQCLYDESDVNKLKAIAAREKLHKINSFVGIESFAFNLDESTIDKLEAADLILDCTDNLEARFLINAYCRKNKKDCVFSAAAGSRGFVLAAGVNGNYCFNCVFGRAKNALTCDDLGILNGTSHTAASIQVTEAVKILLGKEYCRDLILFDLWNNSFDKVKVNRNESCEICNGNYENIARKSGTVGFTVAKCRTKAAFTAKPNKNIKLNLENLRKNFSVVMDTPILLVVNKDGFEVIVHGYGELVFKNTDDVDKIREIAQEIYGKGL